MIELVYTGPEVEVLPGADVPFNGVVGGCCERYEADTNTLTLTRPGKYLICASANMELPADGVTTSELALSIVTNGSVVAGGTMVTTPGNIARRNNVSTQVLVIVYPNSSKTVGLRNTSVDAIVSDQVLVAVRVGGVCNV